MAQADAGQTVSRLLNTKLNLFTYGMAELGERMGRIADELMATGTGPVRVPHRRRPVRQGRETHIALHEPTVRRSRA